MSVRAVVAAAPAAAGQCFSPFLLRPSAAMPAASTHNCPQLIFNISGQPETCRGPCKSRFARNRFAFYFRAPNLPFYFRAPRGVNSTESNPHAQSP
eukprot:1153265-Pelagomonas_calceolata.AAC.1